MKKLIGIVGFFFFVNILFGQTGLTLEGTDLKISDTTLEWQANQGKILFPKYETDNLPDLKNYILNSSNSSAPGIYPTNSKGELAFFCKVEAKIEKSSKLPVRFRLGEVQAVDAKEGKWTQFQQH